MMRAQARLDPASFGFTVLLGALAGLPPLSTDMFLPGLPPMQAELRASAAEAALVLSLFFVGFGVAQLVLGPLSDRIGRRPVLLGGLGLYTAAGFGCVLAPSIELLLACRLLQGIGAAGGTVLAFAIVRDVYSGEAARARLSTISMIFSIAPVIGPSLGGILMLAGGWRGSYALLAAGGLVITLVSGLGLDETRVRRSRQPGLYGPLLRDRRVLGYSLVSGCSSAAVLAFVTGSPLILLGQMGLSPGAFGAIFALVALGIITGNTTNRALIARGVGPTWPLRAGFGLALLAALGLCALAAAGRMELRWMIPLLFVNTFCRGITAPNATHAALEPMPERAGAVSALMGCLQMLMAGLSGSLVGLLFPAFGAGAVAVTMAGFSLAAVLILAWTEWRR